ncbi:uncharacterized protein LOC126565947 [Anopheles maculipalpis]|uniref:uncharacterized protein LOC126565947 n=1 Tax=Anopheles maculipalpis TaxID=1496333 RepID=UPI00215930B7|nr:uncharacterized protein LOC126565947 [Anopheles maculipalpis]
MCGLLPIWFPDLFSIFLRKPPVKKEICDKALEQETEPKPIQKEPKAIEKIVVFSAKPIRPVSKNIDIPKVGYDNYHPIEISPLFLHEIVKKAMRTKNKSRRRAYETLQWMECQTGLESFGEQYKPDRSDSPELMFQMEDTE